MCHFLVKPFAVRQRRFNEIPESEEEKRLEKTGEGSEWEELVVRDR